MLIVILVWADIIPALPGFGFSGPTSDVGWDRYRVARAWAELMHRLGYERYGVQGNDWGSIISPEVGRFDPEHVIGVHVTQVFSFPSGDPAELAALSEEEKRLWQGYQWWKTNLGAYDQLQSTVPQTLAHALADSPVGQLAWSYQMFGDTMSDDFIITSVMLYWLTNTAASSARFYYENAHTKSMPSEPTTLPLGVTNFGVEQAFRSCAERDHKNIIFWNAYDRGSHFATQTAPDLLINDIRAFFQKVRSSAGETRLE